MKIVIIGGGTAGWCAASYLANKRPQHQYVVIESSKIPTIGVGEAATGMFTGLIDQLGFDRWEFMNRADALPKLAIKFENWRKEPGHYFHPIDSSYSSTEELDYMVYHSVATGSPLEATSRLNSLIGLDCTNVAYDPEMDSLYQTGSMSWVLDPKKTADILRKFSLDHGVLLLDAEVTGVIKNGNRVTAVETTEGPEEADLFIDCSGSARIMSKSYDIGWVDYSDYLPVNRAMPFRLSVESEERNPWITSRAMKNGWMWEAPTRHRVGRGYIYSDQFTTAEEVKKELQELYGNDIEIIKDMSFETGVLEKHFYGNVLTLGMGAGFLEPMQATSIHATLIQINDWVQLCLNHDVDSTCAEPIQNIYNQRCQRLYKDMMEFVSIHYVTDRDDTDFWKFVSKDLKRPQKVLDILEIAKIRLLRNDDFDQYMGAAGAPLWIYSMAGLGLFDPALCKKVIEEFGYSMEVISGRKEHFLMMLAKERNSLMSQTDLNRYFLDRPWIDPHQHEVTRLK